MAALKTDSGRIGKRSPSFSAVIYETPAVCAPSPRPKYRTWDVSRIPKIRSARLRPHRSVARSIARSLYPFSLGGAFIADKNSITSPYPPYEIYERETLFHAAAAIYSNCDAVRTRGSLVNGKQHPRHPPSPRSPGRGRRNGRRERWRRG